MPHIKFNIDKNLVDYIPHPKPAGKFVPSWYKKMDTVEQTTDIIRDSSVKVDFPTVKKCLPVRDYLTSGYIIPFWQDTLIRKDSKGIFVDLSPSSKTSSDFNIGLSWHGISQVKNTPLENFTDSDKIGKFQCPWTVMTPKGYSTLFFTPFYHDSDVCILPAVVDTDTFKTETNFPFIFKGEECKIKTGDPLIQALPFKRDDWTSSVTTEDNSISGSIIDSLAGFDSIYNKFFWKRKRYR